MIIHSFSVQIIYIRGTTSFTIQLLPRRYQTQTLKKIRRLSSLCKSCNTVGLPVKLGKNWWYQQPGNSLSTSCSSQLNTCTLTSIPLCCNSRGPVGLEHSITLKVEANQLKSDSTVNATTLLIKYRTDHWLKLSKLCFETNEF